MAEQWKNDSLINVCKKIARMQGVIMAEVTDIGSIKVVIEGMDRELRSGILDIGKRSMLPVQVFYRMPDMTVVAEDKPQREWVDDYYKTLDVPGFAQGASGPPPEEVAKEIKGALKLRRVRSVTRGRPVVAWRLGDSELRSGAKLKFSKETALQWSMGKTLTVRPGATATVNELSSRRPIAFVTIGDYNGIELPIHMMGHFYDVDKVKPKTEAIAEAKKSAMPSAFKKIMQVVGMGDVDSDWGRDPKKDNVSVNQPFDKDSWMTRDGGKDSLDDDIKTNEYEEVVESSELEIE